MRPGTDRLRQFGVDQFLKRLLDQVPEQEPDLVTAQLCDQLGQSGIMALGHRAPPFRVRGYELAEGCAMALPRHGPPPPLTPLGGTLPASDRHSGCGISWQTAHDPSGHDSRARSRAVAETMVQPAGCAQGDATPPRDHRTLAQHDRTCTNPTSSPRTVARSQPERNTEVAPSPRRVRKTT
jgi:hypothetical protein